MSQFDDINKIIRHVKNKSSWELIAVEKAPGRILRENIIADMDMPPFDKSAMDGYACKLEEINQELELIEMIPAGHFPEKSLKSMQCSKIMTGAAVPEGADCVFMMEYAENLSNSRVKFTGKNTKKNICYQGEDYKKGDVLIPDGVIINAAHIAIMAANGYTEIKVAERPGVSLFSTGSELVEPELIPGKGQIRNSNARQLIAQLEQMKMEVKYLGLMEDNFSAIRECFQKAVSENDIIIVTGGASMGDYDLIPKLLEEEGFKFEWSSTGMKPGNPMSLAVRKDKYCFGLSGNPVSSLVQLEVLVKPVLYKLMGGNYNPVRILSILNDNFSRKKANRMGFEPVRINHSGMIDKIPYNGSADINAFSKANAILEFPVHQLELLKGEKAYVRPI